MLRHTRSSSFRNVGLRFGTHQVLAGINLAVAPHETLAVIGESGCGKTVLLKLIVGLLQPTEGEVLFEGVPHPDAVRGGPDANAAAGRVSVPAGRALRQPQRLR